LTAGQGCKENWLKILQVYFYYVMHLKKMIADHEVARYSSALFDYVIQFKKQFFIFDDSRYWFSPRSDQGHILKHRLVPRPIL
jgi:hypothetical protein